MKLFTKLILALMPTLLYAQAIVINHNHTGYSSINSSMIANSMAKLKVAYQHTSHGSQLVTGLNALEQYNPDIFTYSYASHNLKKDVFLNDLAIPSVGDLGHKGDLSWADATEEFLNDPQCDKNVIMWSWCGGCSDNTVEGINKYLNKMSELEGKFPKITFVYMTGHLDGSGKNGNLNKINTIIRNYCIANSKVLFDFADIESYAPESEDNLMEKYADDGCNYDSDADGSNDKNWAEEWITANTTNPVSQMVSNCDDCAHSHRLNCIRKGIATWNLFSAIANRSVSTIESMVNSNSQIEIMNLFPNPVIAEKSLTFEYKANINSELLDIEILNINGNILISESTQITSISKPIQETINISALPSGNYQIRIKIGDASATKSFVVVR